MDLPEKIEAILFLAGEPLESGKLSRVLKTDQARVEKALHELEKKLEERGLRLGVKDNAYSLVTAPEAGKLAQDFMKEELGAELSRATLETLSVIVYKGPVSRSEIDYIRGVNSSFTVRNLMVRGLAERISSKKDSRVWLYKPSFDFLKFMGIEKVEKLPGYEEFRKEMDDLKKLADNSKPA